MSWQDAQTISCITGKTLNLHHYQKPNKSKSYSISHLYTSKEANSYISLMYNENNCPNQWQTNNCLKLSTIDNLTAHDWKCFIPSPKKIYIPFVDSFFKQLFVSRKQISMLRTIALFVQLCQMLLLQISKLTTALKHVVRRKT